MAFNGKALKKIRLEKGFTLQELAEKLGPSFKKQNIYAWENGKCAPRVATLVKLSEVLGVKLSIFFD